MSRFLLVVMLAACAGEPAPYLPPDVAVAPSVSVFVRAFDCEATNAPALVSVPIDAVVQVTRTVGEYERPADYSVDSGGRLRAGCHDGGTVTVRWIAPSLAP